MAKLLWLVARGIVSQTSDYQVNDEKPLPAFKADLAKKIFSLPFFSKKFPDFHVFSINQFGLAYFVLYRGEVSATIPQPELKPPVRVCAG